MNLFSVQSFAVPFIHFHGHCTFVSSPETRPLIWQMLEIGMDRSGGINSFFTPRPRHPDHSFLNNPGSARTIPEAGSKCRRAHLQVPGRHDRGCSGGKSGFLRARISESIRVIKERRRFIDPQVDGIDKMSRIYIDRELAEQIVTIGFSCET